MSEFRHTIGTGRCSAVTLRAARIRDMATRSRGRLRWIGDEPKCAICADNGAGGCAEHHLTHGVSVWLCETHRSDAFLRRDGGHDFVDSLRGMWTAAGRLGTRQGAALATHIRNVRSAPDQRAQPGSYSWPRLREEAERRFAGGEPPKDVIRELRARHDADAANAPSVRTMRRWFHEARWLAPDIASSGRTQRGPRRPTQRRGNQHRPNAITAWGWWYGWPRAWPQGFP